MTEPIAEFSDFDSLVAALRAVREHRDISFADLDAIVGAPAGYFSKVLALGGERKPTIQALCWLFAGLGVKAIIVNDPNGLDKSKSARPRDRTLVRVAHTLNVVTSKRWAQIRKLGPKARMRKLTPQQRSELARRLAMARWHGGRANGNARSKQ